MNVHLFLKEKWQLKLIRERSQQQPLPKLRDSTTVSTHHLHRLPPRRPGAAPPHALGPKQCENAPKELPERDSAEGGGKRRRLKSGLKPADDKKPDWKILGRRADTKKTKFRQIFQKVAESPLSSSEKTKNHVRLLGEAEWPITDTVLGSLKIRPLSRYTYLSRFFFFHY